MYTSARPHPGLADHVRRYTGYVETASRPFRRREVPFAGATLIISFGEPLRLIAPTGLDRSFVSFVAGVWDRAVVTEHAGVQHGIQAELTPLGAFTLFGVPMDELANTVVDLEDLGDRDAAAMGAELAAQPDWPSRFDRLDELLLARAERGPAPAPAAVRAWRELTEARGDLAIGELAREIGWSRRQLAERFREQIGLPPKTVARLLRFRRAVGLIEAGRPLAEVAVTCGYYDQAHLNRDFRALAGCTPREYVAASLPDGGGTAADT